MQDNTAMEIVGLRLISGEHLLTHKAEVVDNCLRVHDSIVIEVQMNYQMKSAEAGLRPLCPFSKKGTYIDLSPQSIVFWFQPSDEIAESYKSAVTQMNTGLVIPEKQGLLLG